MEKIGGGRLGSLGLVIADERHESLESALLRKLNCVLLCCVAVESHFLLQGQKLARARGRRRTVLDQNAEGIERLDCGRLVLVLEHKVDEQLESTGLDDLHPVVFWGHARHVSTQVFAIRLS